MGTARAGWLPPLLRPGLRPPAVTAEEMGPPNRGSPINRVDTSAAHACKVGLLFPKSRSRLRQPPQHPPSR
jgi:hypothetical protein